MGYTVSYDKNAPPAPHWGRIGAARDLALKHRGKLDLSRNLAEADGVSIVGTNLLSAMIDAMSPRLRVAVGQIPACELPYRVFRLTRGASWPRRRATAGSRWGS